MRSFQECPSCRALLTDEQIADSRGACPYCSHKLQGEAPTRHTARGEYDALADRDNPYAPPAEWDRPVSAPVGVPRSVSGKLVMAFQLLFGMFPLIAALVFTIWIPGNLLLEMVSAANPNGADPVTTLRLANVIELVFGPIYAAGIITALARRLEGEKTSYQQAITAGLHHWGRLFAARLLAGLLVGLGLLLLVVPGLILAVRFILVDQAVVLEGASPTWARQRSAALTRGQGAPLFLAGAFSISLILIVAIAMSEAVSLAGFESNPFVSVAAGCLVNSLSVYFLCVLTLFYWEVRQTEKPSPNDIASL